MTQKGFDMLCQELNHLKDVERPKIIAAISSARAHGDLSENAEYHAAKDKQRQIESRISHLEKIKQESTIIDLQTIDKSSVRFGCKVKILNLDNDKEINFTITSEYESNPSNGDISIDSPIAKAVIGRKIGDTCELLIAGKHSEVEILDII